MLRYFVYNVFVVRKNILTNGATEHSPDDKLSCQEKLKSFENN